MSTSIDSLREALGECLASAPEGRILLSRLGVSLRLKLPGFTAKANGFTSLRALAEAFPDLGYLVKGERQQEWWFISKQAIGPGEQVTPSPLPSKRSGEPPDRLRLEWWEAFVGREVGATWFDLATLTLTTEGSLVDAEPERFLEVPRFDLRQFCERWVRDSAPPWMSEAAFALESHPWKIAFDAVLRAHGAFPTFKWARNQAVVAHASAWMRDHGIDAAVVVEPVRVAEKGAGPSASGALRAALHRLIDRMSDEELAQISVPVHSLMKHLGAPQG
jgi:hypothetical protein